MAEAVKQFFVGFIHPRTWLAAILGIVVAVITAVALGGALTSFFETIFTSLGGGYAAIAPYLESIGVGIFLAMLNVYTAAMSGSLTPLLVLVVGAVVAGLIFGLTAKKERVASKSIIGGLNIGIIYIAIVLVVYIFWISSWAGFTALYNAVIAYLTGLWLDVLVSFLIVWWVSAILSILILSMKHD
nr:hypothetical protein [Candidatus Njordarchaeota archaeon]